MGTSIVIAVRMNGSNNHLFVNSDKAKGKEICTKKKGGINVNLEIGGNSQTMFRLPIDQAEPYNLNFEAQMHQSLNNKQHVPEVTYPVMFCTISVSTPHRKSKLSQKKVKLRINTTTPRK
jgi:hypothetical protein